MIHAIDFDHTIHDTAHPIKGRRMGPPMEGAKEALTKLKNRGDSIIIHSIWGGEPKTIADWMKYYEIPYNSITNVKPQADFYIDNKSVHFKDWNQTMDELKSRGCG